MTIVEFIGARLAEDETAAQAAMESIPTGAWSADGVEHDPERAIRQSRGSRLILAAEVENLKEFDAEFGCGCSLDDIRADRCGSLGGLGRSDVLRGLASFWSTHPDYRPEWALAQEM